MMKAYWIAACVLIAVGTLALVYGQFSYTKSSDTANLGPIQFTVTDRETVNIPVWAGVGSIALGVGLMAVPLFKR
jgi:hypothetical protein